MVRFDRKGYYKLRYTDAELKELGIERITAYRSDGREYTAYIYKCNLCGRPTMRRQVTLNNPVICALCKTDAIKKRKAAADAAERQAKELERLMGLFPEHEDRFSKAAKKARATVKCDDAVQKAAENAHKYASMPEALAAILMISCGLKIIPQAKIFKDKRSAVDFVLPDHKTVIEIDGELFHSDEEKQWQRDYSIQRALGTSWTVLHIPAEALVERPAAFRRYMLKRFGQAG